MKNIRLLVCFLFLSFPLVKILGSDFDFKKAKEYFEKCQCDTASKKDCEEALRYCAEYLENEKLDIDKINEVKILQKKIGDCLECIKSIKTQKQPIPTPSIPKVNKQLEPQLSTAEEKKQKQIKIAWNYNHKGNRSKNHNEAIDLYTKAIEHNPKFIYYSNRARAKINNRDYDGAIVDAKEAIERYNKYGDGGSNEDGGESYRLLGEAYSGLGEYQNAINSYTEAINWYDNHKKTGLTYVDASGKPISLPISEFKAQVYNSRGVIYCKLHKFNDAYADFVKAYELDPDEVYDRNRNRVAPYIK